MIFKIIDCESKLSKNNKTYYIYTLEGEDTKRIKASGFTKLKLDAKYWMDITVNGEWNNASNIKFFENAPVIEDPFIVLLTRIAVALEGIYQVIS